MCRPPRHAQRARLDPAQRKMNRMETGLTASQAPYEIQPRVFNEQFPNLLLYLESLALRAFLAVYVPRVSPLAGLRAFFGHELPAAVRCHGSGRPQIRSSRSWNSR